MNDVMLFGDGWSGELFKVETNIKFFEHIPHDQEARSVMFFITTYITDNGITYLIGTSDLEPLQEDIEMAISNFAPAPTDFPPY
ncbi:hypothetical protein ACM916_000388 [Cronobacter turicensis]|uniref:hypothetical protein n=1 Tax=Cronobacter turicensis TaxID=413502 RepID=UPI000CFADE0C|nr:hypothetical protein [Cronobacter turicensis]ELY4573423.1 hypothetical protein [Cronobacter turicensis]ELY5963809.1 hypothetical protein [Cronobacter turicensis]